jgi:CheY-like chemotaxis protein
VENPNLKTHRILIVEDNEELAQTIQHILEENYTNLFLTFVTNGEAGLELIKHNVYDLIISDHRMPKMFGAEFIKLTRLEPKSVNHHTPVLFLSGYIIEIKNLTNEFDGIIYIEKPFHAHSIISNAKILMDGIHPDYGDEEVA